MTALGENIPPGLHRWPTKREALQSQQISILYMPTWPRNFLAAIISTYWLIHLSLCGLLQQMLRHPPYCATLQCQRNEDVSAGHMHQSEPMTSLNGSDLIGESEQFKLGTLPCALLHTHYSSPLSQHTHTWPRTWSKQVFLAHFLH